MYNYYNKQSHDAYEKSKGTINQVDRVIMAPSSAASLGYEGTDRFAGNVMPLLDYRGLSLWFPISEHKKLLEQQRTGDLKAQKACVQLMRWYNANQAEFFQDDGDSAVEDGCILSYVNEKRQEGERVLVITQSEELARTLLAWNRDETLSRITVKQISRYGYLKNHQAFYDFINVLRSRATLDELQELNDFDPLITN